MYNTPKDHKMSYIIVTFKDLKPPSDFFGYDTRNTGNKSKYKQVGLHQTKKLRDSKGNHQQIEMTTYVMGENICNPYI